MDILKTDPMQLVKTALTDIPGVRRGLPQREVFLFPDKKLAGLPRGALIAISGAHGAGKTELVLRFLASNPGVRAAWVEDSFTIYPCAFSQHGVGLERVLFVQTEDSAWAVHQVLKSQVFEVVVMSAEQDAFADPVALRRFQLAAEKNVCSVIFLTERTPPPDSAWPVSVQLHVSRDTSSGEPVFEVVKCKN
jgi:hypothetical protein